MEAICINNINHTTRLTIGKIYSVKVIDDKCILTDDLGNYTNFYKNRFKEVSKSEIVVKCVDNEGYTNSLTIGKYYTVKQSLYESAKYSLFSDNGTHIVLCKKRFKPVEIAQNTKENTMNKDNNNNNNKDSQSTGKNTQWSFNVQSYRDIDFNEVYKDLTRKSPLAIVKVNKSSTVSVVIHYSIIDKAKTLQLKRPASATIVELSECIFKGVDADLKVIIDWVKEVKSAPWKEYQDKDTVTVILPTI